MDLSRLIQQRSQAQVDGAPQPDDFHLALVLESGGLGASAVGGMAKALVDAGLANLFDSVHGSSAGACIGAYFLTQQTDIGGTLFLEHLPQPSIVNLKDTFRVPSVVNVDKIVYELIENAAPLDYSTLLEHIEKLHIVLTERATGDPVTLNGLSSKTAIQRALNATLRIPGPNEKGVEINETFYVDGGISTPLAIQSALQAGATHILALCAKRPEDYAKTSSASSLAKALMIWMFHGAGLAQSHMHSSKQTAELLSNPPLPAERIKFILRSNASPQTSVFSRDLSDITAVWKAGLSAGQEFCNEIERA